jgi:hypothetical protein
VHDALGATEQKQKTEREKKRDEKAMADLERKEVVGEDRRSEGFIRWA